MSPVPLSRRLVIPNFSGADPKQIENWRALDAWQTSALPGGFDLFYSTPKSLLGSTRATETFTLPPLNSYQSLHIIVQAFGTATSNLSINIQGDTGANYQYNFFSSINGGAVGPQNSLGTATPIFGFVSNSATKPAFNILDIGQVNASGTQKIGVVSCGMVDTLDVRNGHGMFDYIGTSTGPLTSVTIFSGSTSLVPPSSISAYGVF